MPTLRLAFLAAVFAVPAAAQPVAAPGACTYDTCALRVEPGFFGRQIVRGADGEPAGRLGLLGSDLGDAVRSSERALEQARIYEGTRLPAVLAALGTGALILAASVARVGGDNEELATGALVGAAGLSALGVNLQLRSERALSRAVWEYNRDLPR